MYVIVNAEGKVYNGSLSDTRHIWAKPSTIHFHVVIFPLKEEAEDIQQMLGVEGTTVTPITDLSI